MRAKRNLRLENLEQRKVFTTMPGLDAAAAPVETQAEYSAQWDFENDGTFDVSYREPNDAPPLDSGFVSNVQKADHQAAMSIIGNLQAAAYIEDDQSVVDLEILLNDGDSGIDQIMYNGHAGLGASYVRPSMQNDETAELAGAEQQVDQVMTELGQVNSWLDQRGSELTHETLDPASPMDHHFVLFAQLVDAQNRDDVLEFTIALQNRLHAAGDGVVPVADILRIEDPGVRCQRIDRRIDPFL